MSHSSAYFSVGKIAGKHDSNELKRGLDALPGVMSVSINSAKNQISVDFDDTGVTQNKIQRKLEDLGYHIESVTMEQITE